MSYNQFSLSIPDYEVLPLSQRIFSNFRKVKKKREIPTLIIKENTDFKLVKWISTFSIIWEYLDCIIRTFGGKKRS